MMTCFTVQETFHTLDNKRLSADTKLEYQKRYNDANSISAHPGSISNWNQILWHMNEGIAYGRSDIFV